MTALNLPDRDPPASSPLADAARPLRIAVAIATSGRPQILAQTVGLLARQTRPADGIVICPAKPADVDASLDLGDGRVTVVHGPQGLPAQRNTALAACEGADIVVFFDDDFFADRFYLQALEILFGRYPDVVMTTGTVAADGILGPGIDPKEALAVLTDLGDLPAREELKDVANGYGCNMAVRMDVVRDAALRFDEGLPLYGWLEDVDFSRRLARFGRIILSNQTRGVHLGNKGGRSNGVRLGYSQVANPLYMVRKGTLGRRRAYAQIGRNFLANMAKTARPEPWIDRRGRLVGNLRAVADALRGRADPMKIVEF